MAFCAALLILFRMFTVVSMYICNKQNGTDCCAGFKWNHAQNKCISTSCKMGFHGINCETKCLYPMYGPRCQFWCFCYATNCHHANGCIESTNEYQIQSTAYMNSRIVTNDLMGVDGVRSDEKTTTNFNPLFCDTKAKNSQGMNTLFFGIIGLTTVSVIIYMMYLYTRVLEKRQVIRNTV